jgi:DNA-binding CsgD family transcriptional regulator
MLSSIGTTSSGAGASDPAFAPPQRAPPDSAPAGQYSHAMPLLERDPLVENLRSRLADARGGRGSLVLVTGEAGIGKTALVDAFSAGLPRGTRLLRGGCDPVVPARPFAPISDMADQLRDGLRAALASEDRDRVIDRFLGVLRELGSGSVIVFEDLHWADSATLDLLRVVGRRLSDNPVLIVGTARGDEIDADHPLRLALGEIPPRLITDLQVPALTRSAIGALVAGTGIDPEALHDATGGNPFFVTEVIAAGGQAVPATVRDAVNARVARLSPEAQRVLRAAAVLGSRIEHGLIVAIVEGGGAPAGLRECLARAMLVDYDGAISFRHELARRSVLDATPAPERTRLQERALAALRSGIAPADAVRLAHHAIEAGNGEAIVEFAPAAAEQAARLGAHGEAADNLAVALAFPGLVDDHRRGELLETYAYECSVSDRLAAARSAEEAALAIWRDLDDTLRVGDGLRALAHFMWLGGEGDRAREVARSAVETLESIEPPGRELARAYAKLAQLILNSGQDDVASQQWASRSLELAEQLSDEPTAVHALTTLALGETYQGAPTGLDKLEEALPRARAANLPEDTIRILINLVETGRDMLRFDLAERYAEEATRFLRDHDFELYRHHLSARIAQIALSRGRWDAAESEARGLLDGTTRSSQARTHALEVLGILAARRGQPGAKVILDEAMTVAGPGELQSIVPLHAARAETAWLAGDLLVTGDEAEAGLALAEPMGAPFWYSDLSFWAWRTSRIERLPDGTDEAYVLHAAGAHRAAAEQWARRGCPYQQAEALADSNDETDLREALGLLQALGAQPLATRVIRRLRDLGAGRIPRGPRATTRANPAGLSQRELEVLALIRAGARNAEIADRLVLSPKTVDHHVSAVFRKLGVRDRNAARREADRLQFQDGEPTPPT